MAWTIDDLDSPSVLIDLDKVEANLKRAQAYADSHGVRLRPHIKTHKLPELAKLQLDLGAIGITCQKLGEAEVMADAGITDILLTFNLLGRPKMAKLVDLANQLRKITLHRIPYLPPIQPVPHMVSEAHALFSVAKLEITVSIVSIALVGSSAISNKASSAAVVIGLSQGLSQVRGLEGV